MVFILMIVHILKINVYYYYYRLYLNISHKKASATNNCLIEHQIILIGDKQLMHSAILNLHLTL